MSRWRKRQDGRLVGHGFARVELDEFLKAQAIPELHLGLRIAQAVEISKNHDAQEHANADGGPSAVAVDGGDTALGLSEIHLTGDDVEHTVGAAALLHGQSKEGRRFVAWSLHADQINPPHSTFKMTFAEIPNGVVSADFARKSCHTAVKHHAPPRFHRMLRLLIPRDDADFARISHTGGAEIIAPNCDEASQ